MQTQIEGVTLEYEDSGEKNLPAVLIMHGWGCDHTTVASIAALFHGKMRVVNVDLPGHGKSSEPPAVWSIEDFTRAMEKFIDFLGLEKPALIGHSFGGRISILMSSRREVSKVVLVDSAGIRPSRPLKYYLKVYSFKAAKRILPLLLGKERGSRAIDAWRGKAGSADYRNSSPLMRAVMSKCVNEDLKSVMPYIKAPVLLVWGENDTATPLSDAKTMERLIPDAGLVAFPGCGHYSFLDNPRGFKAVINEFFKPEFTSAVS
ncbi:MAG: alpha/beta hydrolase [Muribaculaceae bacterium]|nr:alpha/beta hydrolase [Muribaculaceae bacterium]